MSFFSTLMIAAVVGQPSVESPVADRLVGGEFFGSLASEVRGFVSRSNVVGRLGHAQASVALQPGYVVELSRDTTLKVVVFGRADQADSERTHFDLREFWLETFAGDWVLGAGVGQVFWGVTESRHLVDIVNQTDLVENLDGEDKLGQPMLRLSYTTGSAGTFDVYWMALQRARTYGGPEGRFGPPVSISANEVEYDSPLGRGQVDLAARWSHAIDALDVGVSLFYGTSREPVLEPRIGPDGPFLSQRYDLIRQLGVDLQYTAGGWLLKLESIGRAGQGPAFAAITSGFEYTFNGIVGAADLGVIGEYSYDGRDNGTFNLFDNELFGGLRLALNDEQSAELLAGAAFDVTNGSTFINVEASRRIGDSLKIGLETRWFFSSDEADPAFTIRRDDYVQVELAYHF